MILKHRVWNHQTKSMLYLEADKPYALSFIGDVWCVEVYGVQVIPWSSEFRLVMLYTGSEDKNGKKIYRGDIVKYSVDKYDHSKIEDAERHWKEERYDVVEFVGAGFQPTDSDFGYEGEDLIGLDECEVVGNIFENVDLIDKIIEQNKNIRIEEKKRGFKNKCYHGKQTYYLPKYKNICLGCGKIIK